MKKKPFNFRPLLTVTSVCLVPLALHAQTNGTTRPMERSQPSQPTAPSVPSVPSVPTTPAVPTTPSQPAGVAYPSSIYFPGSAFQPAGTQASMVSEDEAPALQLRAMAGLERESNARHVTGGSTSDTAAILGVGARVDRRYGLQRIRGDVEANTYKYDKESSLDYNVLNYALALDWSITPRFHGVAAADRKQYRDVQTDPLLLINRVGRRTERTELLEGIYDVGAAWRASASVSHSKASSTVPASWDASPDINSARVGVGYVLPSNTTLDVRYRRGDGKYTDPTPGAARGDFKDHEVDAVLKWPVSGKTSIDARLGHLKREHDVGSQRDFSGMVGSALVAWDVTGKTRVVGGVSRDLSASGLASGGHVESDRLFIGPIWKATPLIAVGLRYDHVSRKWKDVIVARDERSNVYSANVDWELRRWLALSGYARRERQTSNLNTGYSNTTVGAAAKVFF